MSRQRFCPSIFCFASILDSYFVVKKIFLCVLGWKKNFDVDCVCETMIISATKYILLDDSFCTVLVTRVDLKWWRPCFNAECMGTPVCDVRKQNPAVLKINPFSVWPVSSAWSHYYWCNWLVFTGDKDPAVTRFHQKRAVFTNTVSQILNQCGSKWYEELLLLLLFLSCF